MNGISWSDPIEIYGDGVENTKLTQNVGQNIFNIGGSYFKIRDIELEGGDGGIRVQTATDNAHFTNLKIHDTTGHAFYTQQETQKILVSFVEIYDANSGSSDCFSIGSSFHNNIMQYIYCHGNVNDGISFWQTGSYSNAIRNNVIIGTQNRGIIVQDSADLGTNIIENNIILKTASLAVHIFAGIELYNNIIHSSSSNAISASDSNTTPKNIKIIANTIVSPYGTCLETNGWDINPSTFEIVNNLFLCGTDGSPNTAISFSMLTSVSTQHNAFYASDKLNYGVSNIGLTSIEGNVEKYADYNFYPKSSSEFLDAGTYRIESSTDIDCVDRDNPPDIGVYEFIASRTQSLFFINPDVVTDVTFTNLCITSNPTTNIPTTMFPTTSMPSTATPTSSNPTTVIPTSLIPTTSFPTSSIPSTSAPTTTNPTTSNPTTSNPTGLTSVNPTTANPTTTEPSTSSPTTTNPTIFDQTTSFTTSSNLTTSTPTRSPVETNSNPVISVPSTSNLIQNGASGEIDIGTTESQHESNKNDHKNAVSNTNNAMIFYIIGACAICICIFSIGLLVKIKRKKAHKHDAIAKTISMDNDIKHNEISSRSPTSQNTNTFVNGFSSVNTGKILEEPQYFQNTCNTITAGGPTETNEIDLNENQFGEGNDNETDEDNEIIEMVNMVTPNGANNTSKAMSPLSVASMSHQSDYNVMNDDFTLVETKGNPNINEDEFIVGDNEHDKNTKGYIANYGNEIMDEHEYITKGNEYDDDIVDI